MARSKSVTISVKVPINWEYMSGAKQLRLRQTVGRDTRVIHSYLGVIERHENSLLNGRNRLRIDSSRLQELTLTALKVKTGTQQRTSVHHDMKLKFPRISQNELVECRQTAVSMYESYLRLRAKKGRKASRPTHINGTRRIPRWAFSQRFKILKSGSVKNQWWLSLRNSFDSEPKGQKIHDRLLIPLKISPFHIQQLQSGDVKAIQVFTDRNRKWWITFAVRVNKETEIDSDLPVAVLGIDLGIEKAACTSLIIPEKVRETRFFVQKDKITILKKYDRLVSELQHEYWIRKNKGIPYDGVAKKLRRLKSKRENVAREYDRVLVKQLLDSILELSMKYTLYISLGRIKNIRLRARRGNFAGRSYRGLLHSWAFFRISSQLKHKLAQFGWTVDGKNSRFQSIPEAWTSIMCWKCGCKGVRPKQNLFICPTCGNKCNADMNGAINIAGRLIMLTESLHAVRGRGKWASAIARSKRPKARRIESNGKSLLSPKDTSSGPRESAAVHTTQKSLFNFSDGIERSDNGPAVVNTVEILAVAEIDDSVSVQENETRSTGGIVSL